MDWSKPALLFLDDRKTTLAEALLRRQDIQPVLLRVRQVGSLGAAWESETAHLPVFELDLDAPMDAEAARFVAWSEGLGLAVRYFCNPSEPRQEIAHRFARLVGLPALSEEQVAWGRNKVTMKRKFADLGFRTSAFAAVTTTADIHAFAEAHGWPVVLKPQEGHSCLDTRLIEGGADVDALAADARGNLLGAWTWMVESFVHDREYECCALVHRAEVVGTWMTWLPAPLLATIEGAINGSVSLRHVPEDFAFDMADVMRRLAEGMEIDHGYMHLDFFASGEALTLGELGLRIAGVEIPTNHGLSWGFSLVDALLDVHVDRAPDVTVRADRFVGDLLLPTRAGRVTAMSSREELLAMEGVVFAKLKVAVGDAVTVARASYASSGYVHVEGASLGEVRARMEAVLGRFRIVTESAEEGLRQAC